MLDVHYKRLSQALDPAARKISMLFRCDPVKTLELITATVNDLPPMTEAEISIRIDMLRGMIPRSAVHQSTQQ